MVLRVKFKKIMIIFIITICSIIIPLQSFTFFKAYNLLSDYILLITNEGIIKYDPQTKLCTTLTESELITGETDRYYISFAQSSSDEGGYIYCRLKNYIFIYDQSLNSLGSFEIKTGRVNCVLNPYKTKDGINTLIVTFINELQKLDSIIYSIDINNTESPGSLYWENNQISLLDLEGNEAIASGNGISCELMNNSTNSNKLLVCFALDSVDHSMNAIFINPENTSEIINYSNNPKEKIGSSIVISELKPNQKESIICIIDNNNDFLCQLYNLESNEFSDFVKIISNCDLPYKVGIKYIKERNEYSAFCSIKYDELYSIKSDESFSNICNSSVLLSTDGIYSFHSSSLLYVKSLNYYYALRSYTNNIKNIDAFDLLKIQTCNNFTAPKISSSIPKTSIISTSIFTTMPTSSILSTSIINRLTTTSISSTSIINKVTSMQKSLISTTSIMKEYSTTTNSLISSSSMIKKVSTIPNKSISSTLVDKASESSIEKIKTTILKSLINKSTSLSNSPELSSTIIHSKISSFSSYLSSIFPSLSLQTSLLLSSSPNTIIPKYQNNIINIVHSDGDLIKGVINKTKEELEDSLKEIMDTIEIGKKYIINGDDYNLTITPIKDLSTIKATYVDFTLCEQLLRKECNISSDEILTILQIELDKMNEKALTSQVEYEIYNEEKDRLNLSYCKNVKIKINYEIKYQSDLNKTMIDYFSELGIDVFNIEDSFFNDLCYSFTISNSDLILKDRVSDIYQNYSLCDNGCDYDNVNLKNMTVSCICQVKDEINMEVKEPVLSEIVQDTFRDSSFGVIWCYNLVFDFSNKINNLGFMIFSFLIAFHLICYIIYFINGIKYVKAFVLKEMEKNNYITGLFHPRKKNSIKSEKIENNSNIFNMQNSSIFMNQKKEEKRKSLISKKNVEKKIKLDCDKNKILSKNDILNEKKCKNKNSNNRQPILIVNYNNNYYKINQSSNSSQKFLKFTKKDKNEQKKTKKSKYMKLNKEKNVPGYYLLIQINANNSLNNKPQESKFILDNYNYEEAIIYDKRSLWRIFYICLLSKENILNTFFFNSPLEVQPLRISIFIFTYSCDFALNAMFYFNKNISDKYHYEGESLYLFIFVNNIVITVFSTVASYLIVKCLYCLTNSKESIKEIFRKQEKIMRKDKNYRVNSNKKKIIFNNLLKIYKYMKFKIICFIIIEFLIIIFFFYFVTAFCEVFKNTQFSWVYDGFSSLSLTISLELLISFMISVLYVISIKIKVKFIYNIAMLSYKLG